MMLTARFKHLLLLLGISMVSAGANDEGVFPVCSLDDYGLPSLAYCKALLFGGAGFKGLNFVDSFDHAFVLQGFIKTSKFTREQYKNMIDTPFVLSNRKSAFPISTYQILPDDGIRGL